MSPAPPASATDAEIVAAMAAADQPFLGMSNAADVRTLGINAAKAALVYACWHAYPQCGLLGRAGLVFVLTIWSFYVATTVHNAMHRDVFRYKALEYPWRVVLSAVYGFPVEAYRPTHNLNHHVLTNLTSDHLYTYKVLYPSQLWNLLLFFPTVMPSVMALEQAWIKRESAKLSKAFFLYAAEMAAAYSVWGFLIYQDVWRFLVLWFLPSMLSVDMILTMNVLQHDGCAPIQPGKHKGAELEINCARNFVGPVINYFTCNNGYHTIHHMYNMVHWSQYPQLHERVVKPRMDPKLDEQCIVRYLWRTFFWPAVEPAHRVKQRASLAKTAASLSEKVPAVISAAVDPLVKP